MAAQRQRRAAASLHQKVKRLFDILASAAGLHPGAPFVLLGALAVKLTSRGRSFTGSFARRLRSSDDEAAHDAR